MQNLSQDRIAQLAYQLWQERGSPDGSPEVDWERAVRMLESSPAPDNEALSVPESVPLTAGSPPARGGTKPDRAAGGASTPRARGKGRTVHRSAI